MEDIGNAMRIAFIHRKGEESFDLERVTVQIKRNDINIGF